ncbi:MAG: transcription termination factor Rho [Candidatus Omnitrophica bacterium]|nr:transcription termination factor Rho [Candidatus Omnitrophota bacterium]
MKGRHVPPHQGPRSVQRVPLDGDEARFYEGTPIDPSPRIRLEDGSSEMTVRALDLICPIGMGQRGLIVAQPGSGKTTFLKHICQAINKGYPDVKLYCLLVDERPEEVTDFKRSVTADVRASSSDQDYEHHVRIADELMRQARCEAGAGHNVVVLIDSLTRLSRVHNAEGRSSGRTISGGLDSRAMEVPRRIFGAARKIEHGGSLTILATILVDTGSRMDNVIFEEFKGTGNMEIVLSRELSNRRIYPAIDIPKSATRKMELLLEPEEMKKVEMLRRALLHYNSVEAGNALIKQLTKYPTNKEFLAAMGEVIDA